jgi:hypothetical protein
MITGRTTEQPFRKTIVDAIWALDPARFWTLPGHTILGMCPICKADLPEYLVVRFHGQADRADLRCSLGCDEQDIGHALTSPRRVR